MTIEIINSADQLAALSSDWDRLAGDVPFRSFAWQSTWWRHFGSESRQLTLNVIVVRDPAGRVIGIAPCYIESHLARGRVLRLLGDGEVCSDHLSLLADPACREEVINSIAWWLQTQRDAWDHLDWQGLDGDDADIVKLISQLNAEGCRTSLTAAGRTWAIALPDDWEAFLAMQSKSHRKQLRQAEARILQSSRSVWHRAATNEELQVAWPVLIDLHQRRRNSLNEPGCFASRRFASFHREVAGLLLKSGQLRLSWLAIDGKPAAAEYHFTGANTTFAYQGGVDPERLADEPGRLSTIAVLQAAIAEGHTSFDLLRGDEPYKAHWRAVPRPTARLRMSSPRRSSRIRNQAVDAVGNVAHWLWGGNSATPSPELVVT